MDARDQVLITVAELASRIRSAEPVTLLDVRWRLDEPDGHSAYLRSHLPGAVYVSLEDELSDHTVVGRGRHPLPSGRSLQAAARRWGIQQDGLVVAYDDWHRAGSARAWWVLSAAGIDNVRILDGGLAAWRSAEEPLETGPVAPPPGNVLVRHDDLAAARRPTLTVQQSGSGAVPLLDARSPERFRGDVEPVDPVAGHIPGAINLPSAAVLACDGTFLDKDALTRLLSARGIDRDGPVGAYCGSGITAAVIVAALAAMGREAALYPGSWSEWSADPTRPIARASDRRAR
ncbi:sulfurtransferase [Mycobacterium kansasii]|uniref:sulfurtransferase n=1 Tax=Mycobacterium kansasii TaxID=1768 RepID=UPI000CDDB594|nr:sulfurtransferase [Mycobacterium kansasii]POY01234.1 sulfurtransferase [Mycobacterium kansasii]